jgi:hypothetical protein
MDERRQKLRISAFPMRLLSPVSFIEIQFYFSIFFQYQRYGAPCGAYFYVDTLDKLAFDGVALGKA